MLQLQQRRRSQSIIIGGRVLQDPSYASPPASVFAGAETRG